MDWAQTFNNVGLAIAGAFVAGSFGFLVEKRKARSDAAKELAKDRREKIWEIGVEFIEISDGATACLYWHRDNFQRGITTQVEGGLSIGDVIHRLPKV